MSESKDCIICQRIPPKIVFSVCHKILDGKLKNQIIHKIAIDIINEINKGDKINRIHFCGQSHSKIIGSLLYIVALRFNFRITQDFIATKLDLNPVTIRNGIRKVLSNFPHLNTEIKELTKGGHVFYNITDHYFCPSTSTKIWIKGITEKGEK